MTTSGDGRLGVNVWWTVPSAVKDCKVAQAAMKKNGFEEENMPMPTRHKEVSRAAYSFQNRMGKDNNRITDKVMDTATTLAYGILEREQESSDESKFVQKTTVRLNRAPVS